MSRFAAAAPDEWIGRPVSVIDTPSLVIDLDAMERNLASMADFMRRCGKQWRPHSKGHKSPIIAQRQREAGAIGITVAKTSEAMVHSEHGIRDILVAHCVVGPAKLARVVELCRRADPVIACDHYVQAEAIAAACREAGVECRMVIEINLGMNRLGVRPGTDSLSLAKAMDRLPGIRFAGIMGYEGHLLTITDRDEKRDRISRAMNVLAEVHDQIRNEGLACDIVSAGGTGSFQIMAECPGITEVQAGGGLFADPFYTEACGVEGLTPSLGLVCTVVSRPKLERAVLDGGRKSLTTDVYPPRIERVLEGRSLTDAGIVMYSAEHLTLELGPDSRDLRIGDKVVVRPGYSDLTTALHDAFFGVRNGVIESVIPIAARGCLW